MIIKYDFDLYECEKLNIYNGKVNLNGKRIPLKKVQIVGPEDEILLDKLYDQLAKINKRYKLQEYLIVIDENFDNMEVRLDYQEERIKDIVIVIGLEFIYEFTEREILVFLAHELGHILDFNFTLKKTKFLYRIKELGKIIATFLIPPVIFYYFREQAYFMYYFLSSVILFSVIYHWVYKYLEAYYSRKQEYKADELAVKLLGDAQEVISAFLILQQYTGQYQEKDSIFSTHPSLNQRMNHLRLRYWYQWVWKFLFGSW